MFSAEVFRFRIHETNWLHDFAFSIWNRVHSLFHKASSSLTFFFVPFFSNSEYLNQIGFVSSRSFQFELLCFFQVYFFDFKHQSLMFLFHNFVTCKILLAIFKGFSRFNLFRFLWGIFQVNFSPVLEQPPKPSLLLTF